MQSAPTVCGLLPDNWAGVTRNKAPSAKAAPAADTRKGLRLSAETRQERIADAHAEIAYYLGEIKDAEKQIAKLRQRIEDYNW